MQIHRYSARQDRTTTETFDSARISVPFVNYGGEAAFLMKEGEIKKGCKAGIWQPDGKNAAFYTCPYCAAINRSNCSDYSPINRFRKATGLAESLWCIKCNRHLRLYYEKELPNG